MDPEHAQPAVEADKGVAHHIALFNEAFSGPGKNVHCFGNTINWIGDLGPRARAAIPLLVPIMEGEVPPFGAWSIKASAARALMRIDPAQFGERGEAVLFQLVTSPEFAKHIAGSLVLGWIGRVSEGTMARLAAHAASAEATQDFKAWFQSARLATGHTAG